MIRRQFFDNCIRSLEKHDTKTTQNPPSPSHGNNNVSSLHLAVAINSSGSSSEPLAVSQEAEMRRRRRRGRLYLTDFPLNHLHLLCRPPRGRASLSHLMKSSLSVFFDWEDDRPLNISGKGGNMSHSLTGGGRRQMEISECDT
jgi:hypothetical protein